MKEELLHSALGVFENAFQLFSSTVERPLRVVARKFWHEALEASDTEFKLKTVPPEELMSDSQGNIYYVPTDRRIEFDKSVKSGDQEQDGIIVPDSATQANSKDKALGEYGILMERLAATPISIPIDTPLWSADSGTMDVLVAEIKSTFANYAELLAKRVDAKGQDARVVATPVTMIISPDSSTPWVAHMHIICKAGIY